MTTACVATTALMFQGQAEEAMSLYVSLFPGSGIDAMERYAPGEAGQAGSVKFARFHIGDHRLQCIDSPVAHGFSFTPSVSLSVQCQDAAELEKIYAELSREGEVLMPLQAWDFSPLYAWITDRFGVSWQLSL
ncbi:MAG: VOC family protein [Alcanivorax sp.]|nr:VOC family protein [Alcanivorax sp.]